MRTKLQIAFLLLCSLTAITAFGKIRGSIISPGFYVNVEGGWSSSRYHEDFAPNFRPRYVATSVYRSGTAMHVDGGFDLAKYFGLEFNVVYQHKAHLNDINHIIASKIENNLIFLAAKAMLPISRRFVMNLDAGFGYVARSSVILQDNHIIEDRIILSPFLGLSMAYAVWTRWAVTLSWVQSPKIKSQDLPSTFFVGTGIRYKFST